MSEEAFVNDDLPPSWVPGDSVRLHNGEKIPVDAEFFAEPPESIGEIVTAQTTLRESKSPMSLPVRLMLVVGLTGLVFYGIVLGFRYLSNKPQDADLGYLFGGIAALITLPCTIYFTRFTHTCSYVGKLGMAEYTLRGSRSNTPRERVLLFTDCHDVTTWQQRHYTNGVYTGTNYKYVWRDDAGSSLLTLNGSYNSEQQTPKAVSPFWFADAGERMWIAFALDRLAKEYDSQGYVDFRVRGKDRVRVGDGYLEFHFGGAVTKLTSEDIKSLSIANGSFSVRTHEARWFSSKGKFSFEYGGMGNAKLFLFAVERLAGYTFS